MLAEELWVLVEKIVLLLRPVLEFSFLGSQPRTLWVYQLLMDTLHVGQRQMRCMLTTGHCQCQLLLTSLALSIPFLVKTLMMMMKLSSFQVFVGNKTRTCF